MAADKLEQLNKLLLINYWGREEGRPEASLLLKLCLRLGPGVQGCSLGQSAFPDWLLGWHKACLQPHLSPGLEAEVPPKPQNHRPRPCQSLMVSLSLDHRTSSQLCLTTSRKERWPGWALSTLAVWKSESSV